MIFSTTLKNKDVRSLEYPIGTVSVDDFLHIMGWGDFSSHGVVMVNVRNAIVNWKRVKKSTDDLAMEGTTHPQGLYV